MLENPVDDNTLALRVLAGLPAEYGMLRMVWEKKNTKLFMSDVTAKLLQVEQRSISVGASKPPGSVKAQAFAAASPTEPFDKKSAFCVYCNNKRHMQRDCHRRRRTRRRARASPAVVVVKAVTAAGPTRVPLWPTLLLLEKPGAAKLA